jgi:predicted GNAT family N-acyltransferase
MTEHPLKLVRTADRPEPVKPKHPLGEINAERVGKHLVLFRQGEAGLDELVDRARTEIPGMTDNSIVRKVIAHNPDCLWAVARRSKFDATNPVGEGFIAMLPLTEAGLKLLAAGQLNTADPDLAYVTTGRERPAGLYMWAVFAPGILAAGIALFLKAMAASPYDGVNLYSRPNTPAGRHYNETLGLTQGVKVGPIFAPNLWVFPRTPSAPLYDTHHPNETGREITVGVARSFDDLMRVVSVRTAVYISEQECPYEEEFDGNDLSGTHLLGYVGGEPAGCVRIRFFAGFAKIERVAVKKEFRHTRLAVQMIRAGIELCRMKGYQRLYGHAQKRLVSFWSHFGFQPIKSRDQFVFSDHEYVEMVANLENHPDALGIDADPYVLNRPEGRWHMPGILERSAQRAVSRPALVEGRS